MEKFLIIFALILFSCNSESDSKATGKPVKTAINQSPEDHSGHDHSGHDHSSHDHAGHDHSGHDHSGHNHAHDHNDDDPNKFAGAFIGIWEYHHSSTLKKNAYVNHWIELKRDQTFDSGVGAEKNNQGKWTLTKEKDGETYIDLDFENNTNRSDEQWRTQINSPVLVLIGNSKKMNTGEILKLTKVENRPQ